MRSFLSPARCCATAAVLGSATLLACAEAPLAPTVMDPGGSATLAIAAASPRHAVTIETAIDFSSLPFSGTFEVVEGADDLGCQQGTFVDRPKSMAPIAPSAIEKLFTCGSGGQGTFLASFKPGPRPGPGIFNGPWMIVASSGDFSDLHGSGNFSVTFTGQASGKEVLTVTIHYAP